MRGLQNLLPFSTPPACRTVWSRLLVKDVMETHEGTRTSLLRNLQRSCLTAASNTKIQS